MNKRIYKLISVIVLILIVLTLTSIAVISNKSKKQALPDGTYSAQVELEGGTGKAYIESPCEIAVEGGEATATFVWSSKNYDYMIVNGEKYLNENPEGHSTFTVPLGDAAGIFTPIDIIADTTAMSVPHEIEYVLTLTLSGDSTQSQSASKNNEISLEKKHYFDDWEAEKLSFATQFVIKRKDNMSVIIIGEDGENAQYILLNGQGTKNYEGIIELIQTPDNTYLVSTSAMDLIRQIGCLENVRFSGTKKGDWYIDAAVAAMEEGELLYAGKYSAPDYELLLSEHCNLAIENSMIYHNPEAKEKLEELGIPVIVEMSSYETHPLGRLEWIKVYGELFGAKDEADSYFDQQVSRISNIMSDSPNGMKIAFFSINSSGLVTVRESGDYITQMIKLIGGEYVPVVIDEADNALSTMNMQVEEFYSQAKDADIIIYNSAIEDELKTTDDLLKKSSLFADFKAVQNGNVYCTGKNFFQQTTCIAEFMEDLKTVCEGSENTLNFLNPVR